MIKLCFIFNKLCLQHGGSLRTTLQLQPFQNGINLMTENFRSKCYLQTSTTAFGERANKSEESEKLAKVEGVEKKDELQLSKILLIEKGRKVGRVTVEEAKHIAKKRNRKLIKVEQSDRRSSQDVYQLVTNAQFQEEETKGAAKEESQSIGSKGKKTITIGCKITDHDLGIKINSLKKWLAHKYTVRITLNNDEADSAERIFALLQKAVHEAGGKTSQKSKSSDGSLLKATFQSDNNANTS